MMSVFIVPLLAGLMFRFRFFRRAALVTLFVLVLGFLGDSFLDSAFYRSNIDPLAGTSETIEPLDFVASRQVQVPDNRLLLVNFGNVNRSKIADIINTISAMGPKVIGISAFFNCPYGLRDSVNCPYAQDTAANRKLADAIKKAGNVVLASKLWMSASTGASKFELDSVELSDPQFQRHAFHGFSNLPSAARSQHDVKAVRSFLPMVKHENSEMLAWAVVVASLYDSSKTALLLNRRKGEELINFRGNLDARRLSLFGNREVDTTNFGGRYYAVDASDILHGVIKPGEVRGRIVLVGFLGDYLGDPSSDEKFFTPLNTQVTGRSNPDSFGLVVNANIISMILDEDYIGQQPVWDALIVNFGFIMLHVSLLLWLRSRWPKMFDLYSTVLIVIQIALFSYLRIWAFQMWTYRLFFDVSIFTLAIAGVGINIYLEVLPVTVNWMRNRLAIGAQDVNVSK